jgi:predicted TIM-barrel fold metal-dependent hydrolase
MTFTPASGAASSIAAGLLGQRRHHRGQRSGRLSVIVATTSYSSASWASAPPHLAWGACYRRATGPAREEDRMYTRNGDRFFVVDGHVHFWDASPENWISGQEQYAKGWIECFHAYMGLGPAETHWPIERFQKYSEEDFVKDVFEDGHVDVGIFQSTYLKEWYREGFNTLERNARLVERYPDRLIANGRWDPREGEAGLRQLEADAQRYGLKGVKLYTAEWYQGSRGWSLKAPESQRFLEKCQELGIKNIHVHKGPTIWPLDKDAFDVSDVDFVATNFPELNFVVEHVGLPRIEDFCFMATQEPNVYAGLAVVIGGLMHARPRFFAKVMGELLFWVGEDKMLFASDYAIWEPKWQVEGFVDWNYPAGEEYSDYPALDIAGKKKILGLNAAKLYDIDVPEELRLPEETPAAREDAQLVSDKA